MECERCRGSLGEECGRERGGFGIRNVPVLFPDVATRVFLSYEAKVVSTPTWRLSRRHEDASSRFVGTSF
ncbi:hypothetical protein EYF80_043396 [Liparis tanakae]|uniref:Uncharacterized protein n=1 Tax=Liparis tanakae TaxID=230148 RepID=A0A4Z2FYW6_9TELE|nr:hypothetical protein EYF80_043396 [Liparis tanakae]